jgi:mono/diheme cytochrome c family protein
LRHLLVVTALILGPLPVHAQAVSGEALYQKRCASCHEQSDGRTPPREALQKMTAGRIMRALDFGAMMTVAYAMRRDEREAVARFLGKPGVEPGPHPTAFCADRSVTIPKLKYNWPTFLPSN